MSLIKLQGNASGTGAFTIAAPNSNTDRTLTLPDATGTLIPGTIDGSGNVAFAGGIYLGGSGSANLLDDYEEGTWTPTLTGSGGDPTVTYSVRDGTYTKVGNKVFILVRIALSSYSGGVDRIIISGLPFTVSGSPVMYAPVMPGLCGNINFGTGYTQLNGIFNVNSTNINLLSLQNNANYRDLTVGNISSSSFMSFSGFYDVS